MAKSRQVFLLCTIVSVLLTKATALPATAAQEQPRNAIQTENDLLDSIYTDCLKKDSIACLKYKLFSFVDKMLGHKDTITITEGVQIVKTGASEKEQGAPRALSGDETIEGLILSKVQSFLETHTIKMDLKGADIVNAISSSARSFSDAMEEDEGVEEGRGKKQKKGGMKMMGGLMAAAALKAALLGKLALAAIALIAGKALLIGKLALVLSAIIGLKSLMKQKKQVTYEVVQHPQHSSSHVSSHESVYGGSGGGGGYGGDIGGGGFGGGASSGHGGWGRSLDAQQLAYRAHAQPSQQPQQQ